METKLPQGFLQAVAKYKNARNKNLGEGLKKWMLEKPRNEGFVMPKEAE